MDIKYRRLIMLILGLAEVMAGLSLIASKTSMFGGIVFILLGLMFLVLLLIIGKNYGDPYRYDTKH